MEEGKEKDEGAAASVTIPVVQSPRQAARARIQEALQVSCSISLHAVIACLLMRREIGYRSPII